MVDSELLEVLTSFKNEIIAGMATKDDLVSLENRMATKEDLASLENRMASKDDLASFKGEFISFKNEVNDRFDAVDERLDFLQHTCSLMQFEHGQKLNIIFDYIKEDLEKHEQYKHHSNIVDTKLMDHSIRLSILESSGVYKSALEQMKREDSSNAN